MDTLIDAMTIFIDIGTPDEVQDIQKLNTLLQDFRIVRYLGASHRPEISPVRLTFILERAPQNV